jgi:diguanylate cyclase (GGDEF)-like protein
VHGPGGDHILRLDRNGVIAADFSLGFGNPVKFEGPLVGMPLAGLCDNDGFLAEAPAGGVERQRFAVRLCAQKSGTLAILRDVTAQRDLVQKLAHAATLDALTGLPNRQAFLHALERSCASGHAGFVAIFDIDQLNLINDRHGDATGDAVLRAFAADASELVRADDSLSRISGGSFAVILPTEDIARAEKIASRLIAKFGSAARAMGDAIVLATASAGIAPWRDNAAETIRDAESALRIAKARDYDRFEVAGSARRRA